MTAKKRSPKAPSCTLEEAVERALKIYDKEGLYEVPPDTVAQDMGYKDAKSGASLAMIASLGYYGLLERKGEKLAISPDVREFKIIPQQEEKDRLILKWLRMPPVFSELLGKYKEGLPSESAITYDLAKQGFADKAAKDCMRIFKKSVEISRYYERAMSSETATSTDEFIQNEKTSITTPTSVEKETPVVENLQYDRIPVRLPGNRRAWLEIPMPFYESDKTRMKMQIDLIISDDEEGAE